MKPLTKSLVLFAVVVFYAFLYVATSPRTVCLEDCQKLHRLDTTMSNKYNYFYGSYRCTYTQGTDTLCIYLKDTTGINWDRFADTVCMYANSVGLYQQKLFLLKSGRYPPDTVARKQCP